MPQILSREAVPPRRDAPRSPYLQAAFEALQPADRCCPRAPACRPPRPRPAPQVIPCTKRFVHDWTICPFAHAGEKAVRRDPRLHNYTGIACPDMKKVRRGALLVPRAGWLRRMLRAAPACPA